MKLSAKLELGHASGDFGKALEGYADQAQALEAEVEMLKADNRLLRYLLAMAHNSAIHRIIDFVRDPAGLIYKKLQDAGLCEIQRTFEEGKR